MTSRGRPARHRWLVGTTVALTMVMTACGDADPPPTSATSASTWRRPPSTTVPERPASTTTTAFDPSTVEGAVEAAYLRSWDVYADAVYDLELDERLFAEVYGGDHLRTKLDEVRARIRDGRAAWVRVEHDYTVHILDEATALVLDQFRNHQVLIESGSKRPEEADPDVVRSIAVTLGSVDGIWKVLRIESLK